MSTMATARGHQHHSIHASDMDVLDAVTSMPLQLGHGSGHDHLSRLDPPPRKRHLDTLHALRRPPIDPIVLAASLSSGPHVTRHHFLHSFGPKVESKQMSRSEREKARQEETERENKSPRPGQRHRAGSYANCDGESSTQTSVQRGEVPQIKYESRQAPRSERLRRQQEAQVAADKVKAQKAKDEALAQQARLPSTSQAERPEFSRLPSAQVDRALNERKEILQAREGQSASLESASNTALQSATTNVDIPARPALSSIVRPPPIQIRCYARTRIPTPHGEIFCHLYRNNRDAKEHLALVVDTAQNAWGGEWESGEQSRETLSRQIRSRTLDEVWGPHETEMERIVRGAYVGRLGPNHQVASKPASIPRNGSQTTDAQAPLVRIHSECYTGETIGSQRCDCGEQLDEAIRLIHSDSQPAKGVVVYLRQEGRGIGLLDKLMAYNLQDMGHDTVSANILLGHLADARKYDVAAEILRDLGLSSCRLLTNNPEKMEALESEGINVQSRVPMVPRVWRHGLKHDRSSRRKKSKQKIRGLEDSIVSQFDHHRIHTNAGTPALEEGDYSDDGSDGSRDSYVDHVLRRSGATMVGSSITRGPELEKYLRTKVERMGHLLDLPQDHSVRSESDAGAPLTDEETPLNEKNLALHDAHAAEVREDDDEDDDEDHILIDA